MFPYTRIAVCGLLTGLLLHLAATGPALMAGTSTADRNTAADSARVWLQRGVTLKQTGERDRATGYLDKAQIAARDAGNPELYYLTKKQKGVMHREDRQFELAEAELADALDFFRQQNDTLHTSRLLLETGRLWYARDRNASALHYYLEAADLSEGLDAPGLAADILMAVGEAYNRLGRLFKYINPDKANDYFAEGLSYNREGYQVHAPAGPGYNSCLAQVNMLEALLEMQDFATADSLLQAAEHCSQVPDNHIVISMKMAEAALHDYRGNLQQAAESLQGITVFKFRFLAPSLYHAAYLELAILARQTQLTDSAYRAAKHAAGWFAANRNELNAYKAHQTLAQWYEADGMTENALSHQKEAERLKNALISEADTETFDELRYRYETELLETRLDYSEQQQALQKRRLLIYLLVFVLTAIILIMALVMLSLRRRRAQVMHRLAEEKAARMEDRYKAQNAELEKARLEKDLIEKTARTHRLEAEMKDQELMLNALRQTEIKIVRKDLKEQFAPFHGRLPRKKDREAFETLLKTINTGSHDDPLSYFETVFKQAYGDFYTRLAEQCPDLTRTEMQLAAMLRLNLTSKEIAHILNQSIASIDKTRHQLRQKLGLKTGKNLGAFLMQMR